MLHITLDKGDKPFEIVQRMSKASKSHDRLKDFRAPLDELLERMKQPIEILNATRPNDHQNLIAFCEGIMTDSYEDPVCRLDLIKAKLRQYSEKLATQLDDFAHNFTLGKFDAGCLKMAGKVLSQAIADVSDFELGTEASMMEQSVDAIIGGLGLSGELDDKEKAARNEIVQQRTNLAKLQWVIKELHKDLKTLLSGF